MKQMVKLILLTSPMVIILTSCLKNKETAEYVSHDSEIFLREEALFIGKWDYLYTVVGTSVLNKVFEEEPSINIKTLGNYEIIKNGSVVSVGVLDTVGYFNNRRLVYFYPRGIRNDNIEAQTLKIINADTLVIGPGRYEYSSDWHNDAYYKRVVER